MNNIWIKTSECKPQDGQQVIAVVHSWSMCTDGRGHSWSKDNGTHAFLTTFHAQQWPMESGHFVDGFLFYDNSYPSTHHSPPVVTYWMSIPELPKDA